MTYKVTALKNVTIRARIRGQRLVPVGNQYATIPSETEEWVTLRLGEARSGLGLVLGVHPSSAPGEQAISYNGGPQMVSAGGWSNEELPKEFLGLFRLEVEPQP